jgi:hypothetical protein
VTLTRRGVNKKHIGLYREPVAEEIILDTAVVEEIGPSVEEQEEMRKAQEAIVDKQEKEELLAKQMENQVEAEVEVPSETDTEEVAEVSSDENPEVKK